MRTRKQIQQDLEKKSHSYLQIEALLDIRDLLKGIQEETRKIHTALKEVSDRIRKNFDE